MIIEELVAMVTGHRPHKLGGEYDYQGPYTDFVRAELRKQLLLRKPKKAISGMAQGVDTIYALLALELKIPLLAAIPFEGQERKWPKRAQDLYFQILSDPLTTKVLVSDPPYEASKLQIRNEYMVDHSNLIFAVYDGTKGGTFNCLQYARKKNKEIVVVNPNGWRSTEPSAKKTLF